MYFLLSLNFTVVVVVIEVMISPPIKVLYAKFLCVPIFYTPTHRTPHAINRKRINSGQFSSLFKITLRVGPTAYV
jgi:hypothetical protein